MIDTVDQDLIMEIKPKQFWKHYKGGIYQIVALAQNNQSDTLYEAVVYVDVNDPSKVWTQSKERFLGVEEFQGKLIPRFELITNDE